MKLYFSLATLIICTILLVTGSRLLLEPLIQEPYVPLGTPITWIGLMALPLSIFFGVKSIRNPEQRLQHVLSSVLKAILVLAVLWVPICYLLAGNFSNSFTVTDTFQGGQLAMTWFWRFTYGLVMVPLLIIGIHWVSLRFSKSGHQ